MISASSPVHLRGNSNGDNSIIDKLHLAEPDPQAHRSTGKRKSDLDLTQNQQSNDNSQKADDVRQGRTQVIVQILYISSLLWDHKMNLYWNNKMYSSIFFYR